MSSRNKFKRYLSKAEMVYMDSVVIPELKTPYTEWIGDLEITIYPNSTHWEIVDIIINCILNNLNGSNRSYYDWNTLLRMYSIPNIIRDVVFREISDTILSAASQNERIEKLSYSFA